MALQQPLAMQPASGDASLLNTAQQFRQYTAALVAAALSFTGSEGIGAIGVPSSGASTGDFAVVQRGAGANASVDVLTGHALINGDDVTQQGLYQCWSDGTVNAAVPLSPPAQRVHRLVLQIQDKLSNGAWTGYQAQLMLLQDTGSGTPALPNSAITLALITVNPADPSVQNAAIADYRRSPGPVSCVATSTTASRNNATLADDPQMQLWGLRSSAYYAVSGYIRYDSAAGADFKHAFRMVGAAAHFYYTTDRIFTDGTVALPVGHDAPDVLASAGNGQGVDRGVVITGTIYTGTTLPNNAMILQWAQNTTTSGGTNAARVLQGSSIFACPIN